MSPTQGRLLPRMTQVKQLESNSFAPLGFAKAESTRDSGSFGHQLSKTGRFLGDHMSWFCFRKLYYQVRLESKASTIGYADRVAYAAEQEQPRCSLWRLHSPRMLAAV